MISEKILVVGDLHLGVNKNNPEFFKIALNYADWIDEICKNNKIDTIVQLGDIFHNREMVHVPTINCANDFFNKLKDYKIHITVGNHDCLYNETSDVNSLKLLKNWPNITIHEKVTTIDGITFCGWGTKMSDIPQTQKIIFGHFDIRGFEMSALKISDHGFTASDLMNRCSLLMSGHYHKPQTRLYNAKPLVYTGSAYQLNWGESGEIKRVCILNTRTLKYEEVENTVSPKFEYIKSSNDYHKAANNFVSVEIDNPEEFNSIVTKLKSLNAVDVRTTIKKIKKDGSVFDADVEQFKGVSISDAIDEYVSLLENLDDTDKQIVSSKIKKLYNKCI